MQIFSCLTLGFCLPLRLPTIIVFCKVYDNNMNWNIVYQMFYSIY